MTKPRISLDSQVLAPRARHPHVSSHYSAQRLNMRRAHPHNRQPRVRLGRPTGPTAYVHWQDYLDIADLHKMPKAPIESPSQPDTTPHESVSEMFARYKHVAENLNDKINHLFGDLSPKLARPSLVEVDESLED